MTSEAQTLAVSLYNDPIGTLTLIPGDQSFFAFNEAYMDNPDRPTLSLSFKDKFGGLLRQTRQTQTSLTPFFSNMLPEGHMRTYLAKKAGVKEMREFHLIWALGKDLPGAVTVTAPGDTAWIEEGPDEQSERKVKAVIEDALRFSLAGIQMKFSAVQEASGGLTIPVTGAGGDWIIKLPSDKYPRVPENELSMMTLARYVGMDVPEHRLTEPASIANLPADVTKLTEPAFAIRRFDRAEGGARIHIEDFAQVFDLYASDKYKKATLRRLAQVIHIEAGLLGIDEFVRRIVFNTLIGNADMHLKNWSLIYYDQRTPSLAPAYDFVSTIPYISTDIYGRPNFDFALKYARIKDMRRLSLDEMRYFAARAQLPETRVIDVVIETVNRFLDVWKAENAHLPMSSDVRNSIKEHLGRLTLITEVS